MSSYIHYSVKGNEENWAVEYMATTELRYDGNGKNSVSKFRGVIIKAGPCDYMIAVQTDNHPWNETKRTLIRYAPKAAPLQEIDNKSPLFTGFITRLERNEDGIKFDGNCRTFNSVPFATQEAASEALSQIEKTFNTVLKESNKERKEKESSLITSTELEELKTELVNLREEREDDKELIKQLRNENDRLLKVVHLITRCGTRVLEEIENNEI